MALHCVSPKYLTAFLQLVSYTIGPVKPTIVEQETLKHHPRHRRSQTEQETETSQPFLSRTARLGADIRTSTPNKGFSRAEANTLVPSCIDAVFETGAGICLPLTHRPPTKTYVARSALPIFSLSRQSERACTRKTCNYTCRNSLEFLLRGWQQDTTTPNGPRPMVHSFPFA